MNHAITLGRTIKLVALAVAIGSATLAAPAFAMQNPAPTQVDGLAKVHEKTRAEVRQELISAEQSGALARTDAIYRGA
jgi:hypothetical protein